MRFFNTSGPCDPERHYTLMRPALVAKGQQLVDQGRYFTIFAPRQAGKTTYFQLLFRHLSKQGYLPIWISFEGLKNASPKKFYETLEWYLQRELAEAGLKATFAIKDNLGLERYLAQISSQSQPMVLVIDEFENIPTHVLSDLLHTFRAIYQKRQFYKLHSLILVGVSSLADLITTSASPFNVVDQLEIPYFTFAEVEELIGQYVAESGQLFELDVIKAIYENTGGQPGLVSALCRSLTNEMLPDRTQPITMDAFYTTLQYFLTRYRDKNISNILEKANEKRDFMLRVLFGNTPIPFSVYEPTVSYLEAHGVVADVNGYVEMPIPLYRKTLITTLRPLINGEAKEYFSSHDYFSAYLQADQLNLNALLEKYREYIQRRGFRAFDTEHLKEGAWHYSLDNFINFFIERIGGHTLIEVPSGRGRTDILIFYKERKYIIETKIFTDSGYYERGKAQLADYLINEGLDEGFYVVFTSKHSASDALYLDELINGKRIHTWLIRTDFRQSSRQPRKKDQAKSKSETAVAS